MSDSRLTFVDGGESLFLGHIREGDNNDTVSFSRFRHPNCFYVWEYGVICFAVGSQLLMNDMFVGLFRVELTFFCN